MQCKNTKKCVLRTSEILRFAHLFTFYRLQNFGMKDKMEELMGSTKYTKINEETNSLTENTPGIAYIY